MNLILLGPPGSGKGTQAKLLSQHFHLNHISSGELLRQEVSQGTSKGKLIAEIMNKGELVPFDTVLSLILKQINASPNGFILDGTPRNLSQAEHMEWFFNENHIQIKAVIYYELDDLTALKRLSNRAREENRSDDTPQVHRERLRIYHQETQPVINYYQKQHKLISVDARPDINTIFINTLELLSGK